MVPKVEALSRDLYQLADVVGRIERRLEKMEASVEAAFHRLDDMDESIKQTDEAFDRRKIYVDGIVTDQAGKVVAIRRDLDEAFGRLDDVERR